MKKIPSTATRLLALCLAAFACTSCVTKEELARKKTDDYDYAINILKFSPERAREYADKQAASRMREGGGFVYGGAETAQFVKGAFDAPHIPNQAGSNTHAAPAAAPPAPHVEAPHVK